MVSNKYCNVLCALLFLGLSGCSLSSSSKGGFVQHEQNSNAGTSARMPTLSNQSLDTDEKEQLMLKAENYPGLIALYKKQLAVRDSETTRLKLARTYYDSGDIDSALFQLEELKKHTKPNAETYYLTAQCLHQQKKDSQALTAVNSAIMLKPDSGKFYNLQGIISASLDDFISARRGFNKARSLMYTDTIVLNNLAVLDISQHHYQDAIARLMPLYRNGQSDEKIRANLLIALANTHQLKLFREIYREQTPGKALAVYQQLMQEKAHEPTSMP